MIRKIAAAAALLLSAGAVSAADLPSSTGASLKDGPVTNGSWAGLYLGANLGYAWDANLGFSNSYTTTSDPSPINNLSAGIAPEGLFAGGQIGYNFQRANNLLWGIETDLQWANITDSGSIACSSSTKGSCDTVAGSIKASIDYFGTLRGRVGYIQGPLLPYITGGFAYAGLSQRASGTPWTASGDTVVPGWTVGAGVEYKVTDHWSVKGEYLFLDFPNIAIGTSTAQDFEVSAVRLGVNYKLGN